MSLDCSSDGLRTHFAVGGDGAAFFKDDDITRDKITSFNVLFFPITHDGGFEGDASFKLGDDISCLPEGQHEVHFLEKGKWGEGRAHFSWYHPTIAFIARIPMMTPKSIQSRRPAERRTAISMT